jgi:hypothetical protein
MRRGGAANRARHLSIDREEGQRGGGSEGRVRNGGLAYLFSRAVTAAVSWDERRGMAAGERDRLGET